MSSKSSRFLRKLEREISHFPDGQRWPEKFVDYGRLRKKIKAIVNFESAHAVSSHRQTDRHGVEFVRFEVVNSPEFRRVHDDFWFIIRAEIDKVNNFVQQQEEENLKNFLALALDSGEEALRLQLRKSQPGSSYNSFLSDEGPAAEFSMILEEPQKTQNPTKVKRLIGAPRSMSSVSSCLSSFGSPSASFVSPHLLFPEAIPTEASLVFARVLLTLHPKLAQRVLSPDCYSSAERLSISSFPALDWAEVFTDFFKLCAQLDWLRKFVVINYLILVKILRKYDYSTSQDSQQFMAEITSEPFYTSKRLAELQSRAEKICDRFIVRNEANSPLVCRLCGCAATRNPVTLSCGDSFCFNCASQDPSFGVNCPVCLRQQNLDPSELSLTPLLNMFWGVSIKENGNSSAAATAPISGLPDELNAAAATLSPPKRLQSKQSFESAVDSEYETSEADKQAALLNEFGGATNSSQGIVSNAPYVAALAQGPFTVATAIPAVALKRRASSQRPSQPRPVAFTFEAPPPFFFNSSGQPLQNASALDSLENSPLVTPFDSRPASPLSPLTPASPNSQGNESPRGSFNLPPAALPTGTATTGSSPNNGGRRRSMVNRPRLKVSTPVNRGPSESSPENANRHIQQPAPEFNSLGILPEMARLAAMPLEMLESRLQSVNYSLINLPAGTAPVQVQELNQLRTILITLIEAKRSATAVNGNSSNFSDYRENSFQPPPGNFQQPGGFQQNQQIPYTNNQVNPSGDYSNDPTVYALFNFLSNPQSDWNAIDWSRIPHQIVTALVEKLGAAKISPQQGNFGNEQNAEQTRQGQDFLPRTVEAAEFTHFQSTPQPAAPAPNRPRAIQRRDAFDPRPVESPTLEEIPPLDYPQNSLQLDYYSGSLFPPSGSGTPLPVEALPNLQQRSSHSHELLRFHSSADAEDSALNDSSQDIGRFLN